MRVVDEEGEWALVGQPRAQPVQPVEPGEEAILGGSAVRYLLEQRASQSCGARERAIALDVGERLDGRRQQLEHDPERELALHRGAARAEDRHPGRAGLPRGRAEQRALADPGRPLDHRQPARAGRGGAQRAADPVQLGLALEKGGSLAHGTS